MGPPSRRIECGVDREVSATLFVAVRMSTEVSKKRSVVESGFTGMVSNGLGVRRLLDELDADRLHRIIFV